MASYVGGKHRIGQEIADIISSINVNHLPWFEPFCGMMGVTRHIKGEKTVTDLNSDIVKMWEEVFSGNLIYPEHVSKEEFYSIQKQTSPNGLKGFILASCCFSGYYGISYGLDYKGGRQKFLNAKKGIEKVKSMIDIKSLTFLPSNSYDLLSPKGMCIYCDPPYLDTCQNTYIEKFDTEKFWNVMREWSKDNLVFISELQAPKDFVCIWEKQISTSLGKSTLKKCQRKTRRIEKLFMHEDCILIV